MRKLIANTSHAIYEDIVTLLKVAVIAGIIAALLSGWM